MGSFEVFIIIAVICLQVYVFFITKNQIQGVENFLIYKDKLKLWKGSVPVDDSYTGDNQELVTVSLITKSIKDISPILQSVVDTINNYLRKNKGAAADFNLIKDIVERQCDAVDEEINHKLPVPIYLGLMGTVMGIIVGLFSLDFEFNPLTGALDGEKFVNSVSALISGVKLAMICSFVGLGMTTVLSSWLYRGAKAKLERQKNDFYDFIQTQLLPQMSKDAASAIITLQSNLQQFNSSFQRNISSFGKIMDEIHDTFDSQVQLQKEMKKMDLTRVANLNVNVLAQLRDSMTEFEKFTKYLSQMNSFVHQTAKLTDSINDQLERTEAVETVVDALEDNIKKNQLVMEKLRQFLERIDEQRAVITATGTLDSVMSQAINELRSHTEQQIRSIKDYTTEATTDLKQLVNSERGHLKSLDKLEKLDNMDKLVRAIENLKLENQRSNKDLAEKISSLTKEVFHNTNVRSGSSREPAWMKTIKMLLLFIVSVLAIIFFTKEIFGDRGTAETNEIFKPVNGIEEAPTENMDENPMKAVEEAPYVGNDTLAILPAQ